MSRAIILGLRGKDGNLYSCSIEHTGDERRMTRMKKGDRIRTKAMALYPYVSFRRLGHIARGYEPVFLEVEVCLEEFQDRKNRRFQTFGQVAELIGVCRKPYSYARDISRAADGHTKADIRKNIKDNQRYFKFNGRDELEAYLEIIKEESSSDENDDSLIMNRENFKHWSYILTHVNPEKLIVDIGWPEDRDEMRENVSIFRSISKASDEIYRNFHHASFLKYIDFFPEARKTDEFYDYMSGVLEK